MGASGGGASGTVSHSAYLENIHHRWLDNVGADTTITSVSGALNSAIGASPWTGLAAYDPDADLAASDAELAAFAAILSGLVDVTDWAALFAQSVTSLSTPAVFSLADTAVVDVAVADAVAPGDIATPADMAVPADIATPIDAVVPADLVVADVAASADTPLITDADIIIDTAALAAQLDDEITTRILPRFRRGMQDINAVVSSAFPIGEAIIEAFKNREVAKHASGLRINMMNRNSEIGIANVGKETQIILANLRKKIDVGTVNLNKGLDVVKINLSKNLELSKTNLGKTIEVGKVNLGKNLEISKANLGKNTEIVRINLGKGTEVAKANLGKSVEVAKTNITKSLAVGDLNIKSLAEYKRMYLEATGQMSNIMARRITWKESLSRTTIEANRIRIVAKKEQLDRDSFIDKSDAQWDLEMYQHGSNLLAAIGGGTVVPNMPGTDRTASAIGGAMAIIGAAASLYSKS